MYNRDIDARLVALGELVTKIDAARRREAVIDDHLMATARTMSASLVADLAAEPQS